MSEAAALLPRACAFLGGALAAYAAPEVPAKWAIVALGVAAVLCGLLGRRGAGLHCIAWGGGGFVLAALAAGAWAEARWSEALAGERVLAEVVVDGVPVAGSTGWRFDADLELRSLAPGRRLRARLTWPQHELRPQAGERWQLVLVLQPPRGQLNPAGHDPELGLFRDGVHALGTVLESRLNRRLDAGHRPLDALRERIARRIEQRVPERDAAALIAALAVGVTGEMSQEQWRVFNATGTTHLVAISGLHVTLFALLAFAFCRRFWSAVAWRWVPWPRESFAAAVGLAAAAGYAGLAGFSVPTQRTLIMLAAWLLARCAARQSAPFAPLGVALVAVLLLDPSAPLAAGFWLSFAAMAVILTVTTGRLAPRGALREAAAVQLAVTLALAPLTLAWFGAVPLAGLVANAAAIPALSFVFIPLVLLAVALMPLEPVSDVLLALAAWLHAAGWPWLVALGESPVALAHAAPPAWWYAGAALAALGAALPWPLPLRAALLLWLLPLAAAGPAPPAHGVVAVTVLDVGQGTAIVMRTARHTLLYGVGDAYGSTGRVIERTVVPFLRTEGIGAIDRLLAVGGPARNLPGLTALLASFPVRESFAASHGSPCPAEPAWEWDGVRFETIAAPGGDEERPVHECALRVVTARGSLLLPGDPDARGEALLVRNGRVSADVVLVPRHAASTASSPQFVAAVGARWAIVSGRAHAGDALRPAALRWAQAGATVRATAEAGALRFALGAGPIEPRAMRDVRRLWRAPPRPPAP